jgi:hypothetical protein
MTRIVQREVRKRGFFGWVFLLLFWIFNALMAVWLFSYWSLLNNPKMASNAQHAGLVIGGTIGTGIIVFFWVAGAVVFGLFALLTRGRKIIITDQ